MSPQAPSEALRILEAGGYPPPYGGITVHIQRLCREVIKSGFRVRVADPAPEADERKRALWGDLIVPLRGPGWVKALRLLAACRGSDLVHFHGSALERLWFLGTPARWMGRPYIVSIHSGHFPSRLRSMAFIQREEIGQFLAEAEAIICVSAPLRDFVASILPRPPRLLVVPAFLPPTRPDKVHPSVEAMRRRYEKLVLVSGFPLGNYGISSFLDAMKQISRARSVAAVVVLYPPSDPDPNRYLTEEAVVRQRVEDFARESVNALVFGDGLTPDEFASVQAGCDVFVRNTQTDGDSVALREAGYFGCQIVASTCTTRPAGTVPFIAHDAHDLERAILRALDDTSIGRITSDENNAEPILALYRDVLMGYTKQ